MHILTILGNRHEDYHQGMGLVAAFSLLVLSEAEVLALLSECNAQGRYIPGVWRAESVASATDGYVFQDLFTAQFPEVGKKLGELGILPETYVQKWFVALCVHVLPFEGLYMFLSRFFEHGYLAMFRFGLSLLQECGDRLTKASTHAAVYEVLRMESSTPELARAVVSGMSNFPLNELQAGDMAEIRKQAYEKHLKGRLEAAASAHAEREREAAAAAEAAAGLGQCELCSENDVEYYCADCRKMMCEECRDANRAGHDDDEHMVVEPDDKDFADEMKAEEAAAEAAEAVKNLKV